MIIFLSGLFLLFAIIGLFWLKDRLESPRLARIAYSELVARCAVIGVACVIVGLLLLMSKLT